VNLLGLPAFVLLLAFVFARVEVHIEGDKGWASGLPTWRIEEHRLLDLLLWGKPLTGYFVWSFLFVFLMFHLTLFLQPAFSWRLEGKILACLIFFWIAEDFLWFILNPAFGLRRFCPEYAPWHRHWRWGLPCEYWWFGAAGLVLSLLCR